MTEKQKRFCDEYLVDSNATQAAIRAGYSKSSAGRNANRMMKNDEIKSYIEAALTRLQTKKVADAQEVMEYLTSVLRGESQSSVLARDKIGAERVIEKPPDEKERLRAAELLGKRYGLYTEKVDLDADTSITVCVDYGDGE